MSNHAAAKTIVWLIVWAIGLMTFAFLMGATKTKSSSLHLYCEEVRKLAGAFDVVLKTDEKLYSVTYIQSTNDLLVCTIKGRSP